MGINRRIQLENQLKESCSIPDKKVKKSAEATRETFLDKLAQDAKNATVTSKQTWRPYNALYKPLNEVLVFKIFKHRYTNKKTRLETGLQYRRRAYLL